MSKSSKTHLLVVACLSAADNPFSAHLACCFLSPAAADCIATAAAVTGGPLWSMEEAEEEEEEEEEEVVAAI